MAGDNCIGQCTFIKHVHHHGKFYWHSSRASFFTLVNWDDSAYLTEFGRLNEAMHGKFLAQCLAQSTCSINSSVFLPWARMPTCQSLPSKSISQAQLQPFHDAFHQVEMGSPFSEFLKYTVPQNFVTVLFTFCIALLSYM